MCVGANAATTGEVGGTGAIKSGAAGEASEAAGGREMARRAGSERVAQRGSGGALCVCLPLCFCFFLGLRRLLVSSTEKRRRKNTQRLLKKKERTFREPGALSLCRCCRCWSALWRGFADYRSCYRAAIVSQISELGYLTVQSKWSDEDQQSSSRAAAEQQHTTQTHFFVAPHQPRQPIAGVRVGVCLPSATEAAAHSLHRSERVPAIGWLTCVRLHLVQRGVASAAVTSLIHRPLPALALVRHTPSICCH